MSKKRMRKPPPSPPGSGDPESPGRRGKPDLTCLVVCSVVAAALIVAVWAVPRPTGDLYVAYAGGRDFMDGKIGADPSELRGPWGFLKAPVAYLLGIGGKDDWCFNTADRVWFNQNWGTHVVYYFTYKWGGEVGYLALKMAFLLLAAAAMVLGARQRGAGWPVGILAAGSILVSGHAYIDLRPNLTTLAFAPVMLWLLVRTRGRPHRIWLAVAFLTLWANMHGGFILGLVMMGLWAACNGIEAMIRDGFKPAARRLWPLAAGLAASMVLSAATSPLGYHNLTHPLWVVIGGAESKQWRNVQEWYPVITDRVTHYGTTKEFFIIVGLLGGLAVARLLTWRHRAGRKRRPDQGDTKPSGPVAFDAVLAAAVLYMGFKARRFVPLAAIVTAPMLAALLDWFLLKIRRPRLVLVLAAAMAVAALWPWRFPWKSHNQSLLFSELRFYDPRNPFCGPHASTVYEKMMRDDMYCHEATRFLNENKISGRAVHEWRWEGFLHWHSPQMKLFVGGRAQQVHPLKDYLLRGLIWRGMDSVRRLDRLGVEFVILPPHNSGSTLILNALRKTEGSRWVPIYYDESSMILADAGRENSGKWVRRVAAGDPGLWYPTETIRAWSRAVCLVAKYFGPNPVKAFRAIRAANNAMPNDTFYAEAIALARAGKVPVGVLTEYLVSESARLAKLKYEGFEHIRLIRARMRVHTALMSFYSRSGRPAKARRHAAEIRRLRQESDALARRWL